MNKIARQILQLKNDLTRQNSEQVKLLEETRNLTREAEQEIKWLHANRQESEVVPPTAPVTPTIQTSTNSFQEPAQQDLYKIAENPEKFGAFFTYLDDWIASDRAAQDAAKQSQIQPNDKKWFKNGIPSVEEMLNPQNFSEMLRELEQM